MSVRAATWLATALGAVTVGGAVAAWALLDLSDPDVQYAVACWAFALGVQCVMASHRIARSMAAELQRREPVRVSGRARHRPPRTRAD